MRTTSPNSYPIYDQNLQIFCHPIYDLAKNLIHTLFMTVAAGTVHDSYPKHKLRRAFGDGLFDNYEKVASSKKHTQYFQSRVLKPYPIYDQSG